MPSGLFCGWVNKQESVMDMTCNAYIISEALNQVFQYLLVIPGYGGSCYVKVEK